MKTKAENVKNKTKHTHIQKHLIEHSRRANVANIAKPPIIQKI